MRKLTVTHFTPTFFSDESIVGGGERYVINVCKAANNYGGNKVECNVVSVSSKNAGRRTFAGIEATVLPHVGNTFDPFHAVTADLFTAFTDADVVHVHQPYSRTAEIAMLTARLLHKVVIVTDLGMDASKTMRALRGLDLADLVLCISEFSAGLMRPETHRPVEVIIGPVDTDIFKRTAPCSKKLLALTVCRILPHKGLDRIIRALPPGLPLVVCGQPYDQRYLDHLKKLATGKDVSFVSTASDTDLVKMYQEATVTILASTYVDCYGMFYERPELMGLTLLESMALGTPVLCSRVGAMPELLRNHKTGRVFDNDSELGEFLGEVARNGWPVAGALDECISHVRSNFSLQAVGPKLADLYVKTYAESRCR